MITITHSREDGTLARGTVRGDGSAEILQAWPAYFRWFRSAGCWGIRNTRDKKAPAWKIEKVAENLRAAGHEVTVEITEDEVRPFAEIEAERYAAAEDRAERREDLAARRQREAEAAFAASDRITDGYPMGQPVLIGHHSEGRHRRDLERAHNLMGKGVELGKTAAYHAARAEAARNFQAFRESIPATLRRIERLEAEERKLARALARGAAYAGPELAELRDQLAYWRDRVAAAVDAGYKLWTPSDFTAGDYVRHRDGWDLVERVNPKSLSLPTAPGWTQRKLPYSNVLGRRTSEEFAAAVAEAKARKAAAQAQPEPGAQ